MIREAMRRRSVRTRRTRDTAARALSEKAAISLQTSVSLCPSLPRFILWLVLPSFLLLWRLTCSRHLALYTTPCCNRYRLKFSCEVAAKLASFLFVCFGWMQQDPHLLRPYSLELISRTILPKYQCFSPTTNQYQH